MNLSTFDYYYSFFIAKDAAQGHKKSDKRKKSAIHGSYKAKNWPKREVNFGKIGVLTLSS